MSDDKTCPTCGLPTMLSERQKAALRGEPPIIDGDRHIASPAPAQKTASKQRVRFTEAQLVASGAFVRDLDDQVKFDRLSDRVDNIRDTLCEYMKSATVTINSLSTALDRLNFQLDKLRMHFEKFELKTNARFEGKRKKWWQS